MGRLLLLYIRGLQLGPGDRLPPERELAHRLRVSRTSVRQAIAALEARGVIAVRQGDGTYVRNALPVDLGISVDAHPHLLPDIDIMDAREAIEGKLAELAALRHTASDLDAMEAAIGKMASAIAAGHAGVEAADEFHQAVTNAARSRLLAHLVATLAAQFHSTRAIALDYPDRPRRSLDDHRRILAAIQKGDSSAAAKAMQEHLRIVGDLVRDPVSG